MPVEPIKIKDKVKVLLEKYPETRGSDTLLQIHYIQEYLNISLTKVQIQTLLHAPRLESIRRARQKIQEKGDLLPSQEIQNKRVELKKEYKRELSQLRYYVQSDTAYLR